jgi:hypothetical protein
MHNQKDSPNEDDVIVFVNMSMVNTYIASSLGPTMVVDANEN